MQCNVNRIHETAFTGLTELVFLYLYDNEIHELPVNVFRPLTSLNLIYLSDNLLESLDGRIFEANTELQEIILDRNQINAIGRNFLDTFLSLQTLYVNENRCVDNRWHYGAEGADMDVIRAGLATCFDNFDGGEGEVKTFQIELRGSLVIRHQNGTEIGRL